MTVSNTNNAQCQLPKPEDFLGRRYELKQLIDEGKLPDNMLESHTQLMLENRNILKGFLWKVLDKNSGHVVHLIGTLHGRICVRGLDYPLGPQSYDAKGIQEWHAKRMQWVQRIIHPTIDKVVSAARKVYFEVDMFSEDYQEMQINKLRDFEEKYTSSAFPKPDCPEFVQKLYDKSEKVYGLDGALLFFLKGKQQSEKVQSLESFEEHLSSIEVVLQTQKTNLDNFYFNPEVRLQEHDAGQWGNFATMEALYDTMPQPVRENLEKRNTLMAKKILQNLHEGKKDAYAIGAGHYCGESGLLAILQKAGMSISRLQLD